MEKGTLIKVYNHNDETAVIVYRDENHQKKKIVKTDMMVDYYLLEGEGSTDIFIKQDRTKRFEAPYTKLVEDIVDNLNVIDPVYKQKAEAHLRFLSLNFKDGYHRLKKNIFKIPGIYAADEPLENRAIEWFYDNYSEDLSYNPAKYTAFFDIETDVMWPDGKKRRAGAIDLVKTPDPVNIISLYYNDIIYVFAYNYGTKNPSFRDFITNFADKKEDLKKRIYERNNRTFTRKKKELKGKEIKLEDIKLSLFTTEHEMIRAFFDKVHELDPDFLFAWNMSFDVRTLFGRLENTQADILKSEGEKNRSKWAVREYTKDFISDPKYSTDEHGKPFSPNYYYYISDEGKYIPAANRRDYAEICDGVNWLDQLIMHSILNVNNASDSDALEDVANEMYQIGKVQFPLGMDIFNVAWKNYEIFFEYSIQDTMLLKKIEEELHNATEVFELSALYKCLPKDAFSQTKSTKSFMNYEAKKRGYLLRNNINALNSYWKDPGNQAEKDFLTKFGLNIREQLIREISGQNHELYNILMDRDTHGGFVSETLLNTNKNGLILYGNIKSNSIFANAFDKDYSSLYPSTKHALSIDDDGAIARYAVYDRAIIEKQREMDYYKAYVWKSQPKKKDIQDHWLVTPDGSIEDQNLMIRIYDMLISKTYSKIGEQFLGLPNTEELVKELIQGSRGKSTIESVEELANKTVKSLKNIWIIEQLEKIKLIVGTDFKESQILKLLESKWKERKEPDNVLMMTKDTISTTSVENIIDRFLNSEYIFSAYGVLYKQPDQHVSIFNDLVWDVIKERKSIRKFIAEQRETRGEEFMLTEYTRYNSKQKNRKIVVNAAYGVIASFISVFFNDGPLMGSTQNSITKTGQTLTTIAISNIENWLENNIDFRNISDLLDYVNFAKKYYEANKDINEGYLKYLDEVDEDTFINYLFSLLETNRQVDWNYIKLTSKRLTPMERKSIYYRNNIPAVFGQEIWNGFMSKILDLEVNSKDEEELKVVLGEFGDLIFHTTAIDFIHPERFTRQALKPRDAAIISDTDSVFISVYDYVQKTKNMIKGKVNTDSISGNDLDMAITKVFISLSDRYIKYILDQYLDYINVRDERKSDISMKSEFDYSKILVDGKKMYAGWKVGELSKPLGDESEIDIKGLSIIKTVVVKTLRDKFSDILENNILNTDSIDTLDILYKFDEIEDEIRKNLKEGKTSYLQPASVSGDGAYDIPERVAPWRGTQIWNILNPSNVIDLPGRVLVVRLLPQDDYSFLQEKYPQIYEGITTLFNNHVNLLSSSYSGNSKHKSNKKDVLDIISIPYQFEEIPEWLVPLVDIDLIVDKLMKPGQFMLNAIGVSTPDDYTTNIVDRKIITQIMI